MIQSIPALLKSRYFLLLYFILVVLYAAVGFYSPGYDDELYNIRLVESFGFSSVLHAQEGDVHPPGSYLINWILYEWFGDWSLVRLISSLFSSCCLIYVIESIRSRYGEKSGFLAFLLVGLNPALLLWCTGIRWYAYFVPVLLCICITPLSSRWWYWGKVFFGLVLLAYIGYAAFLIVPALIFLYWSRCHNGIRENIRYISVFAFLASLLYSYQLYIFLTVHIANKEAQVFSLLKSLIGFVIAQISNQGVFPVSIGGVLAAIGTTGLFILGLCNAIDKGKRSEFLIPYWLGVLGLVLSGLAGKARNFVVLSPFQALWFSTLIVEQEKKKYWLLCISFIVTANIIGIVNVVTHQDTTKNSWNLPVADLLHILHEKQNICNGRLLIFSHDPVFTLNLEKSGFLVVSPFSKEPMSVDSLNDYYQCVIALKTYAGAFDKARIERMYAELKLIRHDGEEFHYLGRDPYFKLKQKLDKRFPEFQVEMVYLNNVHNLDKMQSWVSPL